MRNSNSIGFVPILLLSLFFVSCTTKPDYSNSSRATGWKMSGVNAGHVGSNELKSQETGPGLVFVEGGSFTRGKVEDDIMKDWNNTPTRQHVQSFYIDETEVTNEMYLEYIKWIKKVFSPEDENYKNIYSGVVPDTLVWRNRLGYNESLVKNYLRHPAYSSYPVVGVSWIQAVEFCKWRTDRVNEAALERNGYLKKNAKTQEVTAESSFSTETYLAAPTLTYSGDSTIVLKGAKGVRTYRGVDKKDFQGKNDINVYAQRTTGIILPEYRLPTEAEWEYAAAAEISKKHNNNYEGQRKYPWSGKNTYSKKNGDQLANFKQSRGDYNGISGWSNDYGEITNAVKKYPPNNFGIYDMAGNVAEWVADVYRPEIDNETNDFNYFRGNIFVKNELGADRKIQLFTKENIRYDTLSNGKIIALNFPGEIITTPVDDNETFLRRNFDRSYLLNYNDGDLKSTKFHGRNSEQTKTNEQNTDQMYNAPKNRIFLDSLGNMVRVKDKSNTRTSFINDEVRVYKGGSWKDRAYWLSPSQRRFLPQDMGVDYIGFRCAMSRVGAKRLPKIKKIEH